MREIQDDSVCQKGTATATDLLLNLRTEERTDVVSLENHFRPI